MKVTIEVKNLRSQIKFEIGQVVNERLDEQLSYEVQGSFFIQKAKNNQWDGRCHLYSKQSQTFPTGCISIVVEILRDFDIDFTFADLRQRPKCAKDPLLMVPDIQLRPYQELTVQKAMQKGRGLILLATGGGKTLVFTSLLGRYNLSPTVVYMHTQDLLFQTKATIEHALNIKCGQIGAGLVDIRDINVATMQTVTRAFKEKYIKYDEYDQTDETILKQDEIRRIKELVHTTKVIIVDEVHHCACASFKRIMRESKQAYYRFGFTATLREDNTDMVIQGATGPIIERISASDLIEQQYLVPPRIHMYYVPAVMKTSKKVYYKTIYKEHIVNNTTRNKIIIDAVRKMHRHRRSILVLVQQIRHGQLLQKEISQFCQSRFLQGDIVVSQRKEILDDFKNGELDVLVATGLMDEGVDLPIVSGLVLAGAGKSSIRAFQRIGRAIRIYPNKKDAVVIDFVDDIKYLKQHSKKRLECYKKERAFQVKIQEKT